jgi:hypothetical protein
VNESLFTTCEKDPLDGKQDVVWCAGVAWNPEILSAVIGALQREYPALPTFEGVQLVWYLAHRQPVSLGEVGLLHQARLTVAARQS